MARDREVKATEYKESLLRISRVSKTVKGGRRMSFSVLAAVGDEKGKVVKENDHLCLAGDTLIRANGGVFRIKDLVGTTGTVLKPNGEPTPYTACALTRKNAEVIGLSFKDGSNVVCTPDHLFYIDNTLTVAHMIEDGVVDRFMPDNQDVYCLYVPDGHLFQLENGLISSNCDSLRYFIMSGIAVASHSPEWFNPRSKHQIDYNPLSMNQNQNYNSSSYTQEYNPFHDA